MKLFIKDICKFLIYYFSGYKEQLFKYNGAAIPQVTITMISNYLFPVPPIQEQLRIIEKLSNIEPLILEYNEHERNLSKLEEIFPEKLKKSILQYAIEGKLVRQNEYDEPASVLLKRIKEEKEELIKAGKIKRDKTESTIILNDDKNYYKKFLSVYNDFILPSGWEYSYLIDISEFISRGKSPEYSTIAQIPVIAQKCNQKDGILNMSKALYINPNSVTKYGESKISKINDIIINSTGTGTVGRVNILPKSLFDKHNIIVTDSHVTTVRLISNGCLPFYVYYYLKSPIIIDYVEERSEGSTNQIELYAKTIMSYAIPIPPLDEQKRICEKIINLFQYIDN